MKYSCSQFDSKTDDLDKAEESMLQLYIDRAGIQANQTILDLGWAGKLFFICSCKFPSSKFTAVSNSKDQINFINNQASLRGLKNLTAVQQNIMR